MDFYRVNHNQCIQSIVEDVPVLIQQVNQFNIIYFLRLYNGIDHSYEYKVGTTMNLSQRIAQLNNQYNCHYRIIVLYAGILNNGNIIELQIHNNMYQHKAYPNRNNFREIYRRSYQFYDEFIDYMRAQLGEFNGNIHWINNNYRIDDNNLEILTENNQHYLLQCNNNESYDWDQYYLNINAFALPLNNGQQEVQVIDDDDDDDFILNNEEMDDESEYESENEEEEMYPLYTS